MIGLTSTQGPRSASEIKRIKRVFAFGNDADFLNFLQSVSLEEAQDVFSAKSVAYRNCPMPPFAPSLAPTFDFDTYIVLERSASGQNPN